MDMGRLYGYERAPRVNRTMTKRAFDFGLSIFLIMALSPVFLILTTLVYINLGWPVFFFQERPGYQTRSFLLVKFRSMRNFPDSAAKAQTDAERLTRFGRFLRSTSLDELPELFNVLKGEMSFVGPRPLLTQYLPLYSKEQNRRHDVLPGITGWAQVNGRNSLSWEDKFKLDVWYVENRTFWLDIRIIVMTAHKVLLRRGISADGEATMSVFEG